MNISRLGEFGLIERIRRRVRVGRGVKIGIGDDAAWVTNATGSSLVTADLLIERIHFDLRWTSLFQLGYKSLAVNLSDIAAMGGTPAFALLSLGIPRDFEVAGLDEFYRGVNALAREFGVTIIGGDTNVAGSLIISVCVIGTPPRRPVRRRGARPGDDIYVTGTLGDSALGLRLLKENPEGLRRSRLARALLKRHHQPDPRIEAGSLLARRNLATAMIDVSDGLVQDLSHICHASRIGAVVWNERLPLSRAYRRIAAREGTRYALGGGEDYELLFCARPHNRARVEKLQQRAGVAITRIGTCVAAAGGVTVVDGMGLPIPTLLKGHDHFKRADRAERNSSAL